MKTVFSKFKYGLWILFIAVLCSCEGPEGPEGDEGPIGPAGPAGPAGADGADGADGNANVTIVSLLKEDITWTAGDFLGRTANTFTLTESLVDQNIIDHGTVLGFCFLWSEWYPMPLIWVNSDGSSIQHILHTYTLNTIKLYAYQTSGVLNPSSILEYRFLLITDNTVTKSTSVKYDILYKMGEAGVDVNSYFEVMDYFGLDY